MSTKIQAIIKLTKVFNDIPSPIKYHVNMAMTTIPDPNPIKRPGQSNPSNPSTTYLEAKIKRYEIGTPHKAIMNLCSLAHSHMNWLLVCIHISA